MRRSGSLQRWRGSCRRSLSNGSFRGMLVALASAFVAFAPAAALAQSSGEESRTGTRFKKEKYQEDRAVRETLSHYGHCVAGYKSDRIEAFLLDPTVETWEGMTRTPDNRTRCALRDMVSSFDDMRGALSEGWYVKRFPDGPPPAFTVGEQSAPPEDEVAARLAAAGPEDLAAVVLAEFARCVAATAPVQVDRLLRTRVDSGDERAAVADLGPYFGPCAFEGQSLAFDYTGIRSMLAYALALRAVRPTSGAS